MDQTERLSLPTNLKPVSYDLRLEPDFEAETVSGHVEIACIVQRAFQVVELHSNLINITKAYAESKDKTWNIDHISYDEPRQVVRLQLPVSIDSVDDCPSFKLTLDYIGQFKHDLTGLYQSSYETDDGTKHSLVATALEPCYARKVFPCFDEPALKAEFVVSITAEKSFLVVSNMPIDRTEDVLSSSKKLVTFQRTPPMSTYHLGIIAGEMAEIQSSTSRIPMSIFCPIGSESQAHFALALASNGLELFEKCFDSPYPLPKLDLVGVPDFSAGAMENWGVIMFRTGSLLLDPDDSALDTKQSIADCVLHEISHMWFGNLVTMKYWDGLWLKEGFAMLMARYAVDKMFPGWHVWDSYVSGALQKALNLDALKSSHPVELFVKDATHSNQMYDDISYEKGSCILKMLMDNLGEEKFFQGIRLYLHRHQLGNAESKDLWESLEEAGQVNVTDIMQVWTKQVGFPVVKVSEKLGENGQVESYHLRQDRFISSGIADDTESSNFVYPLRITVRTQSGIETIGMNCREAVVPAQGKTLFKVNADHIGFFRTSYTSHSLEALFNSAGNHLTLRDYIGLSCDLRALVAAGENKTSELLNLCLRLRKLSSYSIWHSIDKNLSTIRSAWKFSGPELVTALKKMTLHILGDKAHELGWTISDNDDDQLVSFKSLMFNSAGLAGDEKIISEAKTMFADRVSGKEIPGSLRWEVFGIAAAYGGLEELKALLDLWNKSPNEDEQYLALECLGRAPNADLVKWVLSHIFTDSVKDQDIYYLTWIMGSTSHGATVLWEWTKENWAQVKKALPAHALSYFIGTALDGLHTAEQIEEVKNFFANQDTREYQMVLDQKLESMESRRKWAERDLGDLRAWLGDHGFL